jgi:hypothetical protein
MGRKIEMIICSSGNKCKEVARQTLARMKIERGHIHVHVSMLCLRSCLIDGV